MEKKWTANIAITAGLAVCAFLGAPAETLAVLAVLDICVAIWALFFHDRFVKKEAEPICEDDQQ